MSGNISCCFGWRANCVAGSKYPDLKFEVRDISSKGYRKHKLSMTGATPRAVQLLAKPLGNWSVNDEPPELIQEMVDKGEFIIQIMDHDSPQVMWDLPEEDLDDEESDTPRERLTGFSVNPRLGGAQQTAASQAAYFSERKKLCTAEYRQILLKFLRS